jgi:hypothetical protein
MAQPIWYGIIDCAQDPRLHDLVNSSPGSMCLFKGKDLALDVKQAAPWLVRLDQGSEVLGIWQQHGRAANWGIMAYSAAPIEQLHRHFRRFLQAKLPDGMIVLFRFYDPRVFNTYLRAATPEERAPWFAQVLQFAVQPAGDAEHIFRLEKDQLFDGAECLG